MTEGRTLASCLPALLLAVLAGCALPLAAAPLGAGAEAVPAPEARPLAGRHGLTLDEAIELVERRFRAMVVRAAREEVDGRVIYVFRMLSEQGRVWTVRVDAASGDIS